MKKYVIIFLSVFCLFLLIVIGYITYPKNVIVEIKGEVINPGVYTLKKNSTVKDLIDASSIKKKEYISMNDFFAEISPSISIIVDVNKRNLNYGATAGILTLEQLGILEMTEILDHDVWNIADIDIKRRPIITNIKVKK